MASTHVCGFNPRSPGPEAGRLLFSVRSKERYGKDVLCMLSLSSKYHQDNIPRYWMGLTAWLHTEFVFEGILSQCIPPRTLVSPWKVIFQTWFWSHTFSYELAFRAVPHHARVMFHGWSGGIVWKNSKQTMKLWKQKGWFKFVLGEPSSFLSCSICKCPSDCSASRGMLPGQWHPRR